MDEKKLANLMSHEAQAAVTRRLRQFADALDRGDIQLTDIYVSQNLIDTTPEGARDLTCEPDRTSGLMLLRYVRNMPAQPTLSTSTE